MSTLHVSPVQLALAYREAYRETCRETYRETYGRCGAPLGDGRPQVLIDAVVHAVNEDYEAMADDFIQLVRR